ncbi:MAG TPA: NADH-quinone oxidoreductase subunit A [Acidobacteriota bacterium]|nr:NADH-quinone oxidoreductase subunit A [Acidobacteriota bacterium]
METYLGLLFLVTMVVGNAAAFLALAWYLGPRVNRAGGASYDTPYEAGLPPHEVVRGRFSIKFFVVALLFILFDVELMFLFPWAVIYRELGMFGFVEMFIFLLVVVAGLYYSVKKGALEWD